MVKWYQWQNVSNKLTKLTNLSVSLLTTRPWAERGSCSTCVFFFDQTQTSSRPNFESHNLWCLFAKSCWNVNTRTMLWIVFSLFVCKIYFLLVLLKRWIWREIINMLKTLKKGYCVSHGMRWHYSFHFRYVTNKIMFTLQVYFARSDGH